MLPWSPVQSPVRTAHTAHIISPQSRVRSYEVASLQPCPNVACEARRGSELGSHHSSCRRFTFRAAAAILAAARLKRPTSELHLPPPTPDGAAGPVHACEFSTPGGGQDGADHISGELRKDRLAWPACDSHGNDFDAIVDDRPRARARRTSRDLTKGGREGGRAARQGSAGGTMRFRPNGESGHTARRVRAP